MGLPYAQGQPGGEGNLWVLAWDEVLCSGTGVEKVHPPHPPVATGYFASEMKARRKGRLTAEGR